MDKIGGSEFVNGKGWEEKIWKKFLEDIEDAGHDHKTAKFLDNILTTSEKKIISKRLAALVLIKSGKSYRDIGKMLWISPATVSALKKSVCGESYYQSSRFYAEKSKSEKAKKIKKVPSPTILDYWANLPLPSKTRKRGKK